MKIDVVCRTLGVHLAAAREPGAVFASGKRRRVYFASSGKFQVSQYLAAYCDPRRAWKTCRFCDVPSMVNMLDPGCVDLIKMRLIGCSNASVLTSPGGYSTTWNKGIAAAAQRRQSRATRTPRRHWRRLISKQLHALTA